MKNGPVVRGICIPVMLAACSGEPATGVVIGRELPARLEFVAEASSVDAAGREVICDLSSVMLLAGGVERKTDRAVYHGTGGGDAHREVDKESGNRVVFWADMAFQDLELHLIGRDSVEIRSPASEKVTERFWREFALFAGSTRDAGSGEIARGKWTCQPMDTPPSSGEYYDASGTAAGTWILRQSPQAASGRALTRRPPGSIGR